MFSGTVTQTSVRGFFVLVFSDFFFFFFLTESFLQGEKCEWENIKNCGTNPASWDDIAPEVRYCAPFSFPLPLDMSRLRLGCTPRCIVSWCIWSYLCHYKSLRASLPRKSVNTSKAPGGGLIVPSAPPKKKKKKEKWAPHARPQRGRSARRNLANRMFVYFDGEKTGLWQMCRGSAWETKRCKDGPVFAFLRVDIQGILSIDTPPLQMFTYRIYSFFGVFYFSVVVVVTCYFSIFMYIGVLDLLLDNWISPLGIKKVSFYSNKHQHRLVICMHVYIYLAHLCLTRDGCNTTSHFSLKTKCLNLKPLL